MPQSLRKAWHPDGAGHLNCCSEPRADKGQSGVPRQGRWEEWGRGGAYGQPTPALCQAPQGQTGGKCVAQSSVREVRGTPSPAGDRQGEKTTNRGTEAGENSACSQTMRLRGRGTNTRSELGQELELHAVGKRKPLGLQRDHRGRQGAPESGHPSAQRERTPGEECPPTLMGWRWEELANPWDDQGQEHSGRKGVTWMKDDQALMPPPSAATAPTTTPPAAPSLAPGVWRS